MKSQGRAARDSDRRARRPCHGEPVVSQPLFLNRRVCVGTMFSAAKDLMTSKAAKAYVNDFIKHYGRVDELTIDSKRNRIEVVCQLNGEVSPIGVTIEKYLVDKSGGKTVLEVLDSSSTRPWLQAVLRDHLHGRKIELPSWVAAAL